MRKPQPSRSEIHAHALYEALCILIDIEAIAPHAAQVADWLTHDALDADSVEDAVRLRVVLDMLKTLQRKERP